MPATEGGSLLVLPSLPRSILLLSGTSTWPNSPALPSHLGKPYVPELVSVDLNAPDSLQCWTVTLYY